MQLLIPLTFKKHYKNILFQKHLCFVRVVHEKNYKKRRIEEGRS